MKFLDFTSGWKTYASVAIAIGVAVAQYFGYHIPWVVDFGLGMAGLGFHRAGMAKDTKDTLAAIEALNQLYVDLKSQIGVPTQTAQSAIPLGQPSPKGLPESTITAELNKAQAAK